MHNLIFRSRGRSYRELPLRMFEFGTVYRYEKSGVVHGLTRARGFTQDDAHIYCTRDQMKAELTTTLNFVFGLLKDYGLTDFFLELSTKNPEKFVGEDDAWEEATETLRQVGIESGLELRDDPGGAAFYGPKISVQTRDAIGRSWQMSTIQLDFNLPERFELEYTAADNTRQRPVMIHRALFGSIERFFAILTEHYAGQFPAWLAPVQVRVCPRGGGVQRLPERRRRAAQGRGRPRRGRHLGRALPQEDPQRVEGQGALRAHRGRRGHRSRRGLVPLPRRQPRQPGARGRCRRAHRRGDQDEGRKSDGRVGRRGHDGRRARRLRAPVDASPHGVRQERLGAP